MRFLNIYRLQISRLDIGNRLWGFHARIGGQAGAEVKGGLRMKLTLVGLVAIFLAGCSQQQNTNSNAALERKVATLEQQVNDSKPGLGEIMGVIEQHHAKLYYAGSKADWPLAAYELDEIQEGFGDAVQLYPDKFKNVTVPLPQIVPAMTKGSVDAVQQAIQQKDESAFIKAYQELSQSCSSCHAAENHSFIRIQTPTAGMFSDQDFAPETTGKTGR
jgi:hypothetical protein